MAAEAPKDRNLPRKAIRLDWRQRSGAGVSALALLVVACSAILDKTDGTAVLGLVIVAGFFGFLCIAGVVPTRLQSGEQALEMYDEVAREAEAMADELSRSQLLKALDSANPGEPKSSDFLFERLNSSVIAHALTFEELTYATLADVCARLDWPVERLADDSGFDAKVTTPRRVIFVSFKLLGSARDLPSLLHDPGDGSAYLVVTARHNPALLNELNQINSSRSTPYVLLSGPGGENIREHLLLLSGEL